MRGSVEVSRLTLLLHASPQMILTCRDCWLIATFLKKNKKCNMQSSDGKLLKKRSVTIISQQQQRDHRDEHTHCFSNSMTTWGNRRSGKRTHAFASSTKQMKSYPQCSTMEEKERINERLPN